MVTGTHAELITSHERLGGMALLATRAVLPRLGQQKREATQGCGS